LSVIILGKGSFNFMTVLRQRGGDGIGCEAKTSVTNLRDGTFLTGRT